MTCLKLLAFFPIIVILGCVPQKSSSPGKVQQTVEMHYQMGINFLNEDKTPQAIRELMAAQLLASKNADVEHALGLAYQKQKLYDQAVEQYKKALEIDPKLSEAKNNLGTAYLAKGSYDEAKIGRASCRERV